MAIRERARLFCLFAAGTVVCAAQQDQRATAMQWADLIHRCDVLAKESARTVTTGGTAEELAA